MKIFYIAGPFRGKDAWAVEGNIRVAETLGMIVASEGGVPLIPHSMYRFFDKSLPDQFFLDGTMRLLERCDAIVLTSNWAQSSGARAERARAIEFGLPVFDCSKDHSIRQFVRAVEAGVPFVEEKACLICGWAPCCCEQQ